MTQPPDDDRSAPAGERPGDRARRLAREAREHETTERRVLADRVDELERRVRAQAVDLDVPEHLAALSARLDALEEQAAGVEKATLPAPFDWDDLDPDEHALMLATLTTWADNVLVARYRAQLGRRRALPAGWQDQPHLRDLLTAAWLAWLYAYKNPAARLTEQWQWHRDVLANLGALLEAAAGPAQREHLAAGR